MNTNAELLASYIGLLQRWQAATQVERTDEDLVGFYTALPKEGARLPILYEQLIQGWAWQAAKPLAHDLDLSIPGSGYPLSYSLLGNPQSKTPFAPLLRQMRRDKALWDNLAPRGFIPFGQGGIQAYDPICFDLSRLKSDDCPIIGIDHEQILCFDRVRVAVELAPTFRELVLRTLQTMSGE